MPVVPGPAPRASVRDCVSYGQHAEHDDGEGVVRRFGEHQPRGHVDGKGGNEQEERNDADYFFGFHGVVSAFDMTKIQRKFEKQIKFIVFR